MKAEVTVFRGLGSGLLLLSIRGEAPFFRPQPGAQQVEYYIK